MNKKKWVFILIGMLVLSGIGGRMYMINQQEKAEQRQEKNKLRAEKMAVEALKNTFTDVKSIEFKDSQGPNKMTGSYNFLLSIKNIMGEAVVFDIIYVDGETKLENYGVENRNVQKKGITENKVNVIFSNGKEIEI